jgi:hypothetical protein
MLGFFAGTNREPNGANQIMLTPEQTATRTQTVCAAHPKAPMVDAAFLLADEMKH